MILETQDQKLETTLYNHSSKLNTEQQYQFITGLIEKLTERNRKLWISFYEKFGSPMILKKRRNQIPRTEKIQEPIQSIKKDPRLIRIEKQALGIDLTKCQQVTKDYMCRLVGGDLFSNCAYPIIRIKALRFETGLILRTFENKDLVDAKVFRKLIEILDNVLCHRPPDAIIVEEENTLEQRAFLPCTTPNKIEDKKYSDLIIQRHVKRTK